MLFRNSLILLSCLALSAGCSKESAKCVDQLVADSVVKANTTDGVAISITGDKAPSKLVLSVEKWIPEARKDVEEWSGQKLPKLKFRLSDKPAEAKAWYDFSSSHEVVLTTDANAADSVVYNDICYEMVRIARGSNPSSKDSAKVDSDEMRIVQAFDSAISARAAGELTHKRFDIKDSRVHYDWTKLPLWTQSAHPVVPKDILVYTVMRDSDMALMIANDHSGQAAKLYLKAVKPAVDSLYPPKIILPDSEADVEKTKAEKSKVDIKVEDKKDGEKKIEVKTEGVSQHVPLNYRQRREQICRDAGVPDTMGQLEKRVQQLERREQIERNRVYRPLGVDGVARLSK